MKEEAKRRMARLAYEGYAKFTGGKTFDGRDMPTWEALTPRIQEAWMAAMMAGTEEARDRLLHFSEMEGWAKDVTDTLAILGATQEEIVATGLFYEVIP